MFTIFGVSIVLCSIKILYMATETVFLKNNGFLLRQPNADLTYIVRSIVYWDITYKNAWLSKSVSSSLSH